MRVFSVLMAVLAVVIALVYGPWRPLGVVLFLTDPALPTTLRAGVQASLPAWFWNPLLIEVLRWPAWLFPAAIAFFVGLTTVGKPRIRG